MLEKLAGRLKWEQSGSGIRVEIPVRLDWWVLFLAILVILWIAGEVFYQVSALAATGLPSLVWIGIACGSAGSCIVACWILWGLTGKTVLTLNASQMKLQRRVAGVEWDRRVFTPDDVHNLRYIPPAYIWAFRTDTDRNTSKIQFQAKGKTVRFARGITEREAGALIGRMLEVYNFPKDGAAGYIGVAS
jgi:hypothetical protein